MYNMKPEGGVMYQGTMKCGTPYELTMADAYNGPDKEKGQNVNTSCCWFRIDGGKWRKTHFKMHEVREMMEGLRASLFKKVLGE